MPILTLRSAWRALPSLAATLALGMLVACAEGPSDPPEPGPTFADVFTAKAPQLVMGDAGAVWLAYLDVNTRSAAAGSLTTLRASRVTLATGTSSSFLSALLPDEQPRHFMLDADDSGRAALVHASGEVFPSDDEGTRVCGFGVANGWSCQRLPLGVAGFDRQRADSAALAMDGSGVALVLLSHGPVSANGFTVSDARLAGDALRSTRGLADVNAAGDSWGRQQMVGHRSGVRFGLFTNPATGIVAGRHWSVVDRWEFSPPLGETEIIAEVNGRAQLALHRDAPQAAPVLVWRAVNGSLLSRRFDPATGRWSDPVALPGATDVGEHVAVMAGNGDVHVIWTRQDVGGVWAQQLVAGWLPTPQRISETGGRPLAGAADGQGQAALLFTQGGNKVLFTRYVSSSGWQQPFAVSESYAGGGVALAMHAGGQVAGAWSVPAPDGGPGSRMHVQAIDTLSLNLEMPAYHFAADPLPITLSVGDPVGSDLQIVLAAEPFTPPTMPPTALIPRGSREVRLDIATEAVTEVTELRLRTQAAGYPERLGRTRLLPEPAIWMTAESAIAPGASGRGNINQVSGRELPIPLTVSLTSDNPGFVVPSTVTLAPNDWSGTDFTISVDASASGEATITARARSSTRRLRVRTTAAPPIYAGSWRPYADAIAIDERQGLRLANSIVQRVPGISALVALRENASIHVNQLQGPPGPGLDAGRGLETQAGTSLFGTPSLGLNYDGSRAYVAWHEGTLANSDVRVKQLTGMPNWTNLGEVLDADPAANAFHPVLKVDSLSRPVVAWIENGAVQVKRHDGHGWQVFGGVAVPAPAAPLTARSSLRMALGPFDDPLLAWTEITPEGLERARLVVWRRDGWLDLGSPGPQAPVLRIGLAVETSGIELVAVAEQGGASIQVYGHNRSTGWEPMGAAFNSGIGTPGQRVWDVALDAGHVFTPNGQASPMVAWIERGQDRASVVRWNGGEWQFVGGAAAYLPTAPELVAIAAHNEHPALLVTEFPGGFIGRTVRAWVFSP